MTCTGYKFIYGHVQAMSLWGINNQFKWKWTPNSASLCTSSIITILIALSYTQVVRKNLCLGSFWFLHGGIDYAFTFLKIVVYSVWEKGHHIDGLPNSLKLFVNDLSCLVNKVHDCHKQSCHEQNWALLEHAFCPTFCCFYPDFCGMLFLYLVHLPWLSLQRNTQDGCQ